MFTYSDELGQEDGCQGSLIDLCLICEHVIAAESPGEVENLESASGGDAAPDSKLRHALDAFRQAVTNPPGPTNPKGNIDASQRRLMETLEERGLKDKVLAAREKKNALGYDFNRMQEVVPGLYIGGLAAAENIEYLISHRVTHVVQAIEFDRTPFPGKFVYLKVQLSDYEQSNIGAHFDETVEFIDGALAQGGVVLVHCAAGISRSASLVLAYLMAKRGLSLNAAFHQLRVVRACVYPNHGFRRQLREYEALMRKEGGNNA